VASSSAEAAAPTDTVTGAAAADAGGPAAWEDWDVCKSFFDNHVSRSLQANLEYMYKHFGFYVPDMEYAVDIEGLLKCVSPLCTSLASSWSCWSAN
jgi:pre-60S factor REI1